MPDSQHDQPAHYRKSFFFPKVAKEASAFSFLFKSLEFDV